MQYCKEYTNTEEKRIEVNFRRLKDIHYLDHAGATQYAEEQIQKIHSNFISNVYCNPHTSKLTDDHIDQVRFKILHWFNTTSDDYSVIFTSGTTASLKILAESFDFGDSSSCGSFSYLRDNHTSVLGMREVVKTKNITCIERDQFMCGKFVEPIVNKGNSLLVYPAQCNFNGFKYPLDAVRKFQTRNGTIEYHSNRYVCLDAAAFVSTNPLDLSEWHPDFVCISFYKMFGYPTGLGALIVSRRGENVLNKSYYGGGTVKIALSNKSGWHRKADLIHKRFEDGTLPYLSIISLLAGYEAIEQLIPGESMRRIARHCFNLGKYLYASLRTMKYSNGRNVIHFYHDTAFEALSQQGGIVNFNVLHEDGSFVGFSEVANMAQLNNIYLRTGCFCNPGACQRHLKLTDNDLMAQFEAGHVCGDDNDLIDGVPTGSIRISMGYMTTVENVEAVIKMIEKCFCMKERSKVFISNVNNGKTLEPMEPLKFRLGSSQNQKPSLTKEIEPKIMRDTYLKFQNTSNSIRLHEICIYPVKSCAPYRVSSAWTINRRGLKYDREWMIVRSSGVAMTQKSEPKLCLIQPTINVAENTLSLSFPYAKSIHVPLQRSITDNKIVSMFCQSKVCGDRIDGIDCGDEVANWLDDILYTSGLRLIQQNTNDKRMAKNDVQMSQAISLANQAQFLLINVASVDWLTKKVENWIELDDVPEKVLQNTIDRFRANLIIESPTPLEETEWKSLRIGNVRLTAIGPCTRCQMICIDQSTSEKTTEPLQTIAREFGGKMRFGMYLCQGNDDDGESDGFERTISCDDYVDIEV